MNNYFIKTGYNCNLDDSGNAIPYKGDEHGALAYQVKVYEYAKKVIIKSKIHNVVDIGCGLGLKLEKFIYPICDNIVGIDGEDAISYC